MMDSGIGMNIFLIIFSSFFLLFNSIFVDKNNLFASSVLQNNGDLNTSNKVAKSVPCFQRFSISDKLSNYSVLIDLNKIPYLGFCKKEILSITVVKYKISTIISNTFILIPDIWKFEAKNWSTNYHGAIPYLDNLVTDSANPTQINFTIKISFEQNQQGYFVNKRSDNFGFFDSVNNIDSGNINSLIRFKNTNINDSKITATNKIPNNSKNSQILEDETIVTNVTKTLERFDDIEDIYDHKNTNTSVDKKKLGL